MNWIKINVDASFVENVGDCSVGCIARGHDGSVIWARNLAASNAKTPLKLKQGPAFLAFGASMM